MFEKIGTGLAEHSQNLFIFPFPLSSLFCKQKNEIFFLLSKKLTAFNSTDWYVSS